MSPRALSLSLSLCVGLCVLAGAQDYGPSAASSWQSYPYPAATYSTGGGGGGAGVVAQSGCGPGLNDVVSNIASYKSSLLQTGLSAGLAALLAKLPGLIFLKVLVLKLIVVPMLFMFVAIPVMMPLMMLLMPMMQQMMNMMSSDSTTTTTTTAAPASRRTRGAEQGRAVSDVDEVLRAVLASHRCLERVACKLGAKDKASPYRKPITWLLKQLQGMVPPPYRERVKTYRQAYMAGGATGVCGDEYPCETPEVLVLQESRTFRIL